MIYMHPHTFGIFTDDNDDILSDHPTSLELQEDCFIDGFLGSISASAIGEASGSNVSLLSTNLLDVLHLFSSQDAEGREELDKPFPLAVANDSNYLFYSNLSLVVPDKSNVERVRSKLDVLHYVPTAHSERAIFSAQIRTDKLRINTCTEDCGDASNSDHGVFTSTYRDHGNDQFDTVTNKRLSSNDLHVELFKFEMLDFLLPSSTVGFTHSTHKSYLFRSKLPIHTQGNSTARPPLFSLLSLSSSLPPGNRVKVMLVTPSLSSSIISTALSRQLVNSLLMLTTASPRRGHKAARNPTSISELDTNPSVHRDFLATSEDREETLLRQRTSLLLFMDAAGVFVDVGSAECDRLDYDDDSSLDKAAKFYEGFQVVNRDQDALDKHVEEIEMPLLNLDLASDAEGYLRLPVIERSTLPGPISGPLVITPVSPSLSSSSLPSHALSTLWFFLKNPSFTTRSEMATVSTIKLTWLQQNRLQDPNAPIEMPTFEVVDLSELIHEGVCVLNKFSAVTKSAPGKEKRKKRKKIPPKLNLDVLGISFVYIHREWGVQLLPISSVRPGLCVHNMVYTIPPFVSAIIQVAKLNLEDIGKLFSSRKNGSCGLRDSVVNIMCTRLYEIGITSHTSISSAEMICKLTCHASIVFVSNLYDPFMQ